MKSLKVVVWEVIHGNRVNFDWVAVCVCVLLLSLGSSVFRFLGPLWHPTSQTIFLIQVAFEPSIAQCTPLKVEGTKIIFSTVVGFIFCFVLPTLINCVTCWRFVWFFSALYKMIEACNCRSLKQKSHSKEYIVQEEKGGHGAILQKPGNRVIFVLSDMLILKIN